MIDEYWNSRTSPCDLVDRGRAARAVDVARAHRPLAPGALQVVRRRRRRRSAAGRQVEAGELLRAGLAAAAERRSQ